MRLTLLHKGLLLVSIPLCFEITIFGILINLQNQAELEAQKLSRNKKINDAVNHLLIYAIRLGQARKMRDLSEFLSPEFKNNAKGLSTNFAELEKLSRDEPDLHQQVASCKQTMNAAMTHFDDVKQALESAAPSERPELIHTNRRIFDREFDMARSTGLIALAETSLRATDGTRSRVLRERATLLLKYAVGLSVLTGIFGATMFSKHLTRRLQRLGRKASRLASSQPLEPPESGTDEIAELDRSFHYAANLIAQATRIRQEVTALITHDLKTPLQSIRNFLDMLHSGELGEVDAQGQALLTLSEKETQRMVGLIDSVLQLEQLRSGTVKLQLSTVSLTRLIDKSIEAVRIIANDKNIELKRDFAQVTQDTLPGDSFWLEQVMVNILSNAIKFSPQGSFVITRLKTADSALIISVVDNGPGIPKEQQSLIFERFHRVEAHVEKVAGSGLGLVIAKELVELHKGTITVESEIGTGSTFNIIFSRSPLSRSVEQTASVTSIASGGQE